jgi:hypothetical protein
MNIAASDGEGKAQKRKGRQFAKNRRKLAATLAEVPCDVLVSLPFLITFRRIV